MPVIKPAKDFKYSETGARVDCYYAGEEYDVSEECAMYAQRNGCLGKEAKKKPAKTKDAGAAPKNKAA